MREYCSGQVAVECLGAVKLSARRDQRIIHAARWLNVPRKSLSTAYIRRHHTDSFMLLLNSFILLLLRFRVLSSLMLVYVSSSQSSCDGSCRKLGVMAGDAELVSVSWVGCFGEPLELRMVKAIQRCARCF